MSLDREIWQAEGEKTRFEIHFTSKQRTSLAQSDMP
jgi:hypothetical protein